MSASHRPPPEGTASRVSRRAVLGTAAGATVLAAAGATPAAAQSPAVSRKAPRGFVAARDGRFEVAGRPFRFGGTNCYYLHQQSHYMIDAVLGDAAVMGLTVVRAWAFADGSGGSYKPLQSAPHVYDDAAFDSLDYAVHRAGRLGIRLVLPLVNNWPDYGGMQQYVQWFLGLPDDSYGDGTNHDRFYTDARIRECYMAYAEHVTRHVNRYTGVRYRDDPTIMAFELANEPRCRSDTSGRTLLAWAAEMSAHVKRLAPRQLVAVGDEGFYGEAGNADYPYSDYEGVRWEQLVALPAVDYGTVHLYPQGWGENPGSRPGTDPVQWGTKWITDHLADGRALRKPVVLEEFGLSVDPARGVADEAARLAGYTAWTDAVLDGGGAGDQFWILTSRVDDGSFYPDYDGYRITWNADPGNPARASAALSPRTRRPWPPAPDGDGGEDVRVPPRAVAAPGNPPVNEPLKLPWAPPRSAVRSR
ncbi:cellulase family glycosylhydrolase [Streptomyces sp. NPDC020983]|uniref:glycoside hydrolase 5 family protein n=1 Tax=Streptomyces sp. NPDC020983 TaxID=3365106 RepID=UPI003789041F